MTSIALLWQINTCYRFKHAEMVAATVPEGLQALLESSDIQMPRRVQTMEKIARLIEGGAENISVISDFDHTLTRAVAEDGSSLPVTHQVLGDALALPDISQKTNQEKYAAYSKESAGSDRLAMLEAWWKKAHDGVVAAGLTREDFIDKARKTGIQLRDSSADLLRYLSAAGVPTLLFSAGLSDAITFVLDEELGGVPEGVHVIGNKMIFDENNSLVAFKQPLLHPFNKNASVINNSSPLLSSLLSRQNLVVLGDSMGDLTMEKGFNRERDNTLRIGFLNGKVETLQQFSAGYDIIITSGQSADVPLRIINEIISPK